MWALPSSSFTKVVRKANARLFNNSDKTMKNKARKVNMARRILVAAALVLSVVSPALVWASDDEREPDWVMDTSGVGVTKNGVARSDQILELGTSDASGLQLVGENAMRMGNEEAGLTALQRSVEISPNDMDARTAYANALEHKLTNQKDKDPALYNFVIKQWFFIYKNTEFIDQTLEAKSHLLHLSGSAPKPLEKTDKYLARVLVPVADDQPVDVSVNNTGKKRHVYDF
jgi:hypothetical protein